MSRMEVQGYVNIVIGAIGIAVTILTAPSLLDTLSHIGGGGAIPKELASVGGAIRIFAVLFILIVFMAVLLFGLSVTLSSVFRAFEAKHPTISAMLCVSSLTALAVTMTLAFLDNIFWVPGFVGTIGLVVAMLTSLRDDDEHGGTWGVIALFLFLFFGTGFFTLLAKSAPERPPANSAKR